MARFDHCHWLSTDLQHEESVEAGGGQKRTERDIGATLPTVWMAWNQLCAFRFNAIGPLRELVIAWILVSSCYSLWTLNTTTTDGTLGFLASKLNVGRLQTGEPKHCLDCKKKRTHRTHETPAIVDHELLAVSHCPRLAAATVAAGISKLNLATETSFSCCFQTLQQYI